MRFSRDRLMRREIARRSLRDRRALAIELLGPDVVIDFERDGVRWMVDTGDEIGRTLFTTGGYETDAIAALLARFPTGTVVDLGANVGTTTIPFAAAGHDVVAVEPVPHTFDMLRTNVERNGHAGRVQCVNAAIADEPGTVMMWTGFGSGQAEVAVDGQEPGMTRWGSKGNTVEVDAMTLAEIAPSDTALVWADVQGSETSVIRTGVDLWASGTPLYLEVDPPSLELHSGLDTFCDAASEHFASFLPRNAMLAGETPRPIGDFPRWVKTLSRYSDALLGH